MSGSPARDYIASRDEKPSANRSRVTARMVEAFSKLARKFSVWLGHPGAFVVAIIVVLVWAVTGPLFGFSDTWQLVINTGTTIATFLMIFLVQNTQNHDAKAMHLKLDELLRSIHGARNEIIDLENVSEAELTHYCEEFAKLHEKYRRELESRGRKTVTRR